MFNRLVAPRFSSLIWKVTTSPGWTRKGRLASVTAVPLMATMVLTSRTGFGRLIVAVDDDVYMLGLIPVPVRSPVVPPAAPAAEPVPLGSGVPEPGRLVHVAVDVLGMVI